MVLLGFLRKIPKVLLRNCTLHLDTSFHNIQIRMARLHAILLCPKIRNTVCESLMKISTIQTYV